MTVCQKKKKNNVKKSNKTTSFVVELKLINNPYKKEITQILPVLLKKSCLPNTDSIAIDSNFNYEKPIIE